jgi:hypothetical protein
MECHGWRTRVAAKGLPHALLFLLYVWVFAFNPIFNSHNTKQGADIPCPQTKRGVDTRAT